MIQHVRDHWYNTFYVFAFLVLLFFVCKVLEVRKLSKDKFCQIAYYEQIR